MTKRLFAVLLSLFAALCLFAQEDPTGGVKGTIVNRDDLSPVKGAKIVLQSGLNELQEIQTDANGNFSIQHLPDGIYDLVINADGYLQNTVSFTVNGGYVKDMFSLGLTQEGSIQDVDATSFAEFEKEADESGYNDNPTILYNQNDVFNRQVGYNFSSVRFRIRGYASETQDVYLAGIKMNDAITGYTPFSLWSGLNEATRSTDVTNGLEVSDYGFGGINGVTNIKGMASDVRKGLRGSVLTNSALYRLRLMLTYSSGVLDNGWSYAVSASARLGGNDWIRGVYYRSFAYYASVEKRFNDVHKIGATIMAAPGTRGAQNASTQEVYDLLGDNYYNSNWGYQNGKVRNARNRITHEPIAILKYDYTPSPKFKGSATILYRFGKNGYTALDWYDAQDPRPDYYRNLPSYYYMDIDDYNRSNYSKALWAAESWQNYNPDIIHINWDKLYDINQNNYYVLKTVYGNTAKSGNRSKYVLEERRTDQRDFNLGTNFKYLVNNEIALSGGASLKINRTEYYKIINDLLGGDYYVNVDQFAERDYPSNAAVIQNDLNFYYNHGYPQFLYEGDKYGYDYYAHVNKAQGWVSGKYSHGGIDATVAGRIGYTSFWREGLMRKGLFPGWEEGSETSYGKSETQRFFTWGIKTNLSYSMAGGHRIFGNLALLRDAPNFNQAFMSPRTRNTVIPNLETIKTFSVDANYSYMNNGYSARVTGYFTAINDQSKVISFYDDSQSSFTNFAMTGIDEWHYGVEFGGKAPLPVPNLSLNALLSWGKYIYTSNPVMYQTVDNSAEHVEGTWGVKIPYWMSHPTADGKIVRHYVPSTPMLASSLGLAWNKNYWFVDADLQYFANSYLDMSPLYRTDMATAGPDGIVTADEIEYMCAQEKFDPAFLVNFSVGKSWYVKYKYQIGFSLNVKNLLNNTNVKTGGYEQTRLVKSTAANERYYRFDPKYFYMTGINYMLNVYFRF